MKTIKIKQNIVLLFTLSTIILAGCKSKQSAFEIGGTLEKKTHNEVITDALTAELKYSTLSAKGHLELRNGKSSKKISTVFKIVKDSIMQASIRPMLGFEAIRMSFTPDSIYIIDRMKKVYVAESFNGSNLVQNLDFNYYNLQALLTNQLFMPGAKEVSKNDYKRYNVSSTKDTYLLQTKDRSDLLYNFAIGGSNRILSTLVYNKDKNFTLQWSYDDFVSDNQQGYPTSMSAKVDIAKTRLDLGISYSKLEIDKELEIDNSIPSKYNKVSFKEFLSSYMKK